ncbi:MAG TPA: citrate/2-methylcitrate synthase [Patescibacteria group bacterium]|nr:citrate/2-methylcitrate synthase [Patescibacteria group bacterium]
MAKTITHVDNDETKPALFGERDHMEAAKSMDFAEMIFEVLTEKKPSGAELKLLNLILNLSIDHGPNSPSAVATIDAAKEGKTMGESVGAGMAQIGDRHGGAGGPLMEILYQIKDERLKTKDLVEEYIKESKRIPGMGHRVYKDKDPRAQLIMNTAIENGIGEDYVKIVNELRDELERQSGKSLPINIDGAIAAVFCGFGLKPELGIAVFIIARAPGLCAHYINTQKS